MNVVETKCPEPGIYEDVPFEDYLSWDAVSNSKLKLVSRSLAHYQAGFQSSESPALRIGSLVHAGKLEPLEIIKRYVFMPAFESDPANCDKNGNRSFRKNTNWYNSKVEEFTAMHKDKTVVSASEYELMVGIVRGVAANELASEVLNAPGPVEVSIVWDDPETGLRCKARYDKLAPKAGRFADLKTTKDAKNFSKEIHTYGYHRQCAFYRWGYQTLTGETLEAWLVPVEKDEPFCCCAAPVDAQWVDDGMVEVRGLLDDLNEAIESEVFPGYANPEHWLAPPWYQSARNKPVEVTIGGETALI